MTKELLDKGIVIQSKIEHLDVFIFNAERLWTAKLQLRKPKMIFASNSYGEIKGKELELDNELKNEVLKVIKNKRDSLINELRELN